MILFSKMIPEPGSPGSSAKTTWPYCPWPPVCLT